LKLYILYSGMINQFIYKKYLSIFSSQYFGKPFADLTKKIKNNNKIKYVFDTVQ